jgi:eukaryotic-like serine/threonine-protein kinase
VTEYILDSRYELIERIASGGMGEVWRGNDQMLGRPVAIKLLSATHAGDEQFRARFRAEARYAASLSHPGIARVYDYGESSPLGGPYLVMELVNGEPLSAILDREGRLSPEATLDIVSQAARALDVAHQAGIVHRDIKPGNLLITADGVTKITDFGIAKARSAQEMQLTATGIVMGTALYVSPEQATGSMVTGASDIYSLGVVAYECLAGEPPFMAEQPLAIAIMHKHDPVPPLPADVPAPVSDLVMAMLAKSPEARPESARHVADRADVIRDARATLRDARATLSGDGDIRHTADLPVVPDYPEAMGDFYPDDPERPVGSPLSRHRLAAAGMGVALCGVGAVVAVMLSSSPHQMTTTGDTKSPSASASRVAPPTTATLHPSQGGVGATGTNVDMAPSTFPAQSAQPTTSRHASAGPTSAPATSVAPTTAPASTPTSPSTSASSPSSTPATTPPTSPPSTGGATQKANVGRNGLTAHEG